MANHLVRKFRFERVEDFYTTIKALNDTFYTWWGTDNLTLAVYGEAAGENVEAALKTAGFKFTEL